MPQLGVTLDIPKQIALANVALRVQHRSGPAADEFFNRCGNQWMAVGGVLVVDLLALPPGAKKVGLGVKGHPTRVTLPGVTLGYVPSVVQRG